jgi:hypothetical protein
VDTGAWTRPVGRVVGRFGARRRVDTAAGANGGQAGRLRVAAVPGGALKGVLGRWP